MNIIICKLYLRKVFLKRARSPGLRARWLERRSCTAGLRFHHRSRAQPGWQVPPLPPRARVGGNHRCVSVISYFLISPFSPLLLPPTLSKMNGENVFTPWVRIKKKELTEEVSCELGRRQVGLTTQRGGLGLPDRCWARAEWRAAGAHRPAAAAWQVGAETLRAG